MSVPWSLKGLTVHNVIVALCIAPSLHRELKLSERCELALSGFMALDVFRLLADQKCADMRLPKGSCFMAGQTIQNLQGTALAIVAMAASKEADFKPWKKGTARLSEMSIEEHFGRLRATSSNSQLSTRSYWYASALQAKRMSDALNKLKPSEVIGKLEPPLTGEQFLSCHSVCGSDSVYCRIRFLFFYIFFYSIYFYIVFNCSNIQVKFS